MKDMYNSEWQGKCRCYKLEKYGYAETDGGDTSLYDLVPEKQAVAVQFSAYTPGPQY